jgi:hypothetical protein
MSEDGDYASPARPQTQGLIANDSVGASVG